MQSFKKEVLIHFRMHNGICLQKTQWMFKYITCFMYLPRHWSTVAHEVERVHIHIHSSSSKDKTVDNFRWLLVVAAFKSLAQSSV